MSKIICTDTNINLNVQEAPTTAVYNLQLQKNIILEIQQSDKECIEDQIHTQSYLFSMIYIYIFRHTCESIIRLKEKNIIKPTQ